MGKKGKPRDIFAARHALNFAMGYFFRKLAAIFQLRGARETAGGGHQGRGAARNRTSRQANNFNIWGSPPSGWRRRAQGVRTVTCKHNTRKVTYTHDFTSTHATCTPLVTCMNRISPCLSENIGEQKHSFRVQRRVEC